MIIETFKQQEVIVEGEVSNSVDAEIDIESVGILMSFLSKNIYSDSVGSPIREYCSNAFDSHIKSETSLPILIKLYKENYQWFFTVEDFGLGFDQDDVNNVLSKYLKSTKRLDNKQLGSLGLGFKSGLAYKNKPFTFIGRKNGIERKWMMYEGEVNPKIDCIHEKETTEPNGVKIIMNVDSYDVSDFSSKIKEQLSYFSNIFVVDEYTTFNNEAKIYENDLFKWSENQDDSKMHVCLGEVYYALDFKKLGIKDIYVPIALKVGLDEGVVPTLSRESFIMSPETKTLLLSKIKQVSEWFINKYNEDTKEFDTLKQAWELIDEKTHNVKICDTNFEISDLEQFSDVKFNNIKVKDIVHIPLTRFVTNYDNLVKEYFVAADLKWNSKSFRIKNASSSKHVFLEKKCVLLDQNVTISGWFKEYLKTTDYKVFVKRSFDTRNKDLKFYKQILQLQDYPKSEWRNVIKEWIRIKEQFLKEILADGTDLHTSKEFLEFKANQKTYRSYNGSSNYKTLNKQKGDVTIHHVTLKSNGNGYMFNKQVHSLPKIHKEPYKFIVFDEEHKELAKDFHQNFKNFIHYRFVHITKGEIKKLPKTKQFIMFTQLKEKPQDLKLFSKIATAVLYHSELNIYNVITENIEDTVIKSFSNNLSDNIDKLRRYKEKYKGGYQTEGAAIVQKAFDTNDFDLTLDAEYQQLKKFNEDFSFIQFMKCNRFNKEAFIKELNKQLLFRKLYDKNDMYSNFEICVKEPEIVEDVVEAF